MVNLYEASGSNRLSLVASFETFADAETFARTTYNIADFSLDDDNADCADFFTSNLGVFAIQPANFKNS